MEALAKLEIYFFSRGDKIQQSGWTNAAVKIRQVEVTAEGPS